MRIINFNFWQKNPSFKQGRKRVLIIESSLSHALTLEQLCIEMGFNVTCIIGHSAKVLETIYNDIPDYVFLNLSIHSRFNEITVGNEIRTLGVPIIYLASFHDEYLYSQISKDNKFAYLVKPIEKYALLTILNLIEENRMPRRNQLKVVSNKASRTRWPYS